MPAHNHADGMDLLVQKFQKLGERVKRGYVAAWWIAIPASHDRNWRPEAAVMPRAVINGATEGPERMSFFGNRR